MVGGAEADRATFEAAREIGRRLAEAGAVVLTGGRGGVMEAASQGAAEAGGMTVGILPGDRSEANPYVRVAIGTGLGELRNGVLVRSADALLAVGGAYGTLSEIALALRAATPVIGLGTWRIEGIEAAETPAAAVAAVLERVRGRT